MPWELNLLILHCLCSPLQPSAALCSFCLLILVSNAYPQTNESIGEPYQMQTQPVNPGDPVAEVGVDEESVELLWRSHFGFSKSTGGGTDTDDDGVSDADESDHWTDPWTPDAALAKSGSPELRRQAAMESMAGTELLIDGLPSTPAQVLKREYQVNEPQRQQAAANAAAAAARVADWEQHTGNSRNGMPGGAVVDVIGDSPVLQADQGTLSNQYSRIIPLWPYDASFPADPINGFNASGSVMGGLGYTGYRVYNGQGVYKICGIWGSMAPLISHLELAFRVQVWDNAEFQEPGRNHATAVAGIIGATGLPNYLNYRGAAYQCRIAAYNNVGTWGEIQNLPLIPNVAYPVVCIRDMQASNHSYARNCGWGGTNIQKVRQWFGSLYPAVNAQATGHTPPEDYHFGFYNGDAVEADNAARMQPYHLIVVSAGNDREQAASGSVLSWMEVQSTTQGGTNTRIGGSGSVWFYTELVDGTPVYYCSHLKAYVLETNVTLKLAGTDIDNDGKFNDQDPQCLPTGSEPPG